MDDLVLNVRQIAQYPPVAAPSPSDALLIQQGGIGGNYASTSPAGILAALATLPATFSDLNLTGPITWLGSNISAWGSGNAFSVFDSTAGAVFAATATSLWASGDMTLPNGSLTVGRAPVNPMDVATAQYVTDNTVWSFNDRRGQIRLTLADVVLAGGAPNDAPRLTGKPTVPTISDPDQCDEQIANAAFVQGVVKTRINDLLYGHPFVYRFNGRVGNIWLQTSDITGAGGAPIKDPHFTGIATVPDPRASDYSHQIANTRWVTWQIDAVNQALSALSDVVYQKIDASAFATLDFVEQTYAPLNNANLVGYVTAPTAAPNTNNAQIATTAFVMQAVAESVAGVATFNTRTGNVVLESADITAASGALLDSPAFTGTPTGPTATTGTSSTQLATTAFVMNEISAIDAGVVTFNNRSGAVNLLWTDVQTVGGAPIASPNFSGVPTAATASPGTSTTQLATTAFVTAAIAAIGLGVLSFNGRTGAVNLTANDISAAGGAPIASPPFTGIPTAPTAAAGTSSQQLATTAFVAAAIAGVGGVTTFNTRAGNVVLTKADVLSTGLALQVNIQYFGAPGTTVYTPSPGLVCAVVECYGGGGGGGAAYSDTGYQLGGGGGGSGGYSIGAFTASQIGASQNVTVGQGGVGGPSGAGNAAGGLGNPTSFGANLVSAMGGGGGNWAGGYGAGVGIGSGGGGNPAGLGTAPANNGGTYYGNRGWPGVFTVTVSSNDIIYGGFGASIGPSGYGGNGGGSSSGVAAVGGVGTYAAGGGGGSTNNNGGGAWRNGGAGGNGYCVVTEYCLV